MGGSLDEMAPSAALVAPDYRGSTGGASLRLIKSNERKYEKYFHDYSNAVRDCKCTENHSVYVKTKVCNAARVCD